MQNSIFTEKTRYLTKDEEIALGRLIQNSLVAKKVLDSEKRIPKRQRDKFEEDIALGEKAKEKLVKANIGLVLRRAQNFKNRYPYSPELEDLIQAGMAGMMTAVYKYDPDRGNKFSTVAYNWIAQSMIRWTNKYSRLVRLPENRIQDLSEMTKIKNEILADENLEEDINLDDEIMKRTTLKKTDIHNIRAAGGLHTSLNRPMSSDSGTELMDYVSSDKILPSSEEIFMKENMYKVLFKVVESLSPVKKDVVLSTFSFTETDPDTIRERYSMPVSKFRKMQIEVVEELREKLTDEGYIFSDFIDEM